MKPTKYGSEKDGFMVSTAQLRSNQNSFDDSSLNSTYKSYMNHGVSAWKKADVITLSRSASSVNKVSTYSSGDTSTVVYTRNWTSSTTARIVRFEIKFNTKIMTGRSASANRATAAHEIGHSFGLLDLYEVYNKDKLMYGITNRATSIPVTSDIKGGKYATRK